MDEREQKYNQTNTEAIELLQRMADTSDPALITQLDSQCAAKIQELRGMIKTI